MVILGLRDWARTQYPKQNILINGFNLFANTSEGTCRTIGQMVLAIEQRALKPEAITSIGQVVAGLKPGRENDDEITVFSSEGTNMQTARVAVKIYERVKEAVSESRQHCCPHISSSDPLWLPCCRDGSYFEIPTGCANRK